MAVGNAMVNTTKFEPLSIEQWAAPLKEYATRHEATENALLKLQEDADAYERYIINNPNTDVARQYKNYIDSIENQISQLALNGITPQNRTDLTNLRKQYNDVIKPVKRAVTTYQDIVTQYNKDVNKGVIGAPDIDVSYLLEHPEYTVKDYKKSYHLGTNIYNESKNLFTGLNQFDTTPIYKMSDDGKFVSIITPQSYSRDDIYTAFTGEGYGHPTEELTNTVNVLKQQYGYDNLSDSDKESFLYYAMQGAANSIKNPNISNRAVPKGTKVSSDGTVVKTNDSVPQFKGYTTVTIDNGETLYKKGSQYYRAAPTEDGKYSMTAVTDDVVIGGKVFGQKKNSQPGTLAPIDEKTLIKDFGYHSFGEESNGSPVDKPIVGYKAKTYGDLANIRGWKDITTRIRNYVTSVMNNQGFNNYSFNPNDVEIRVKYTDKKEKDVEDIIVKIKNPSYKASNTSKKQQKDAANDFNWN